MSSTSDNTPATRESSETAEETLERIKREEFEMGKWFASYSVDHDCRKLGCKVPAYLALEDGACERAICEICQCNLNW